MLDYSYKECLNAKCSLVTQALNAYSCSLFQVVSIRNEVRDSLCRHGRCRVGVGVFGALFSGAAIDFFLVRGYSRNRIIKGNMVCLGVLMATFMYLLTTV